MPTFMSTFSNETLIHQDEPVESYINDLLPWSDTLPDLCKSKNKFKSIPLRGWFYLDANEWFTIYFVSIYSYQILL